MTVETQPSPNTGENLQQQHFERADGLSVILATNRHPDLAASMLSTIARQTIDAALVELLIVVNGTDDAPWQSWFSAAQHDIPCAIQLVVAPRAGVGAARNLGIARATRRYVTFIDDDDTLNPHYLARMHAGCGFGRLAISGIEEHDCTGAIVERVSAILKRAEGISSLQEMVQIKSATWPLTMTVLKGVPHYMAKAAAFPEHFTGHEDVVFWTDLLSRFDPEPVVDAAALDAPYERVLTENSISRGEFSYERHVFARLRAIRAINSLPRSERPAEWFVDRGMRGLARRCNAYLEEHRQLIAPTLRDIVALRLPVHVSVEITRGLFDTIDPNSILKTQFLAADNLPPACTRMFL